MRVLPALLVLGAVPAVSQATVFNWAFDRIWGDGPNPDGSPPWARIVIRDWAPGVVRLELANHTQIGSGNFITRLWLNIGGNSSSVHRVTGPDETPQYIAGMTYDQNGFNGPASLCGFELTANFWTDHQNRLTAPNVAIWYLQGVNLDALDFNYFAATRNGQTTEVAALIHIQGIGFNNMDSTWVYAIPGPSALLPFLAGLIGMRRRRRR